MMRSVRTDICFHKASKRPKSRDIARHYHASLHSWSCLSEILHPHLAQRHPCSVVIFPFKNSAASIRVRSSSIIFGFCGNNSPAECSWPVVSARREQVQIHESAVLSQSGGGT